MITPPISKYAQLDGDSYFVKGASEGDRLRLSTRRNQVIESATTTYEELVPGAAISTAGTPKNLMIVARLQVAPAKVDEFIEFAKERFSRS